MVDEGARLQLAATRLSGALLCLGLATCVRADVEPKPETTEHEPVSDEALVQSVGKAKQIAAGDLDGNPGAELVVVDHEWLRVVDPSGGERARRPVPGGIQVLRVADGKILAGWGQTREHRDVRARVSILRLEGDTLSEDIVVEPSSSRAEIVAILPLAGEQAPLLVAHFLSKYTVELAHAERSANSWSLAPIDTIHMATSIVLGDLDNDGTDDLVIGRVYGDDPDGDGDAFVRRPDGTRTPIPVVGGVRSLAVVDLDGDGRLELLVGDGWNRDYGRIARARLTRAWWEDGAFRSELLEDSEGQYTLWDILAIDLDGDKTPEIITRGSSEVRVLGRTDGGWQGTRVAGVCNDVTAIELGAAPIVLLACEDGGQIIRQWPNSLP
jgi:hypothetical protein